MLKVASRNLHLQVSSLQVILLKKIINVGAGDLQTSGHSHSNDGLPWILRSEETTVISSPTHCTLTYLNISLFEWCSLQWTYILNSVFPKWRNHQHLQQPLPASTVLKTWTSATAFPGFNFQLLDLVKTLPIRPKNSLLFSLWFYDFIYLPHDNTNCLNQFTFKTLLYKSSGWWSWTLPQHPFPIPSAFPQLPTDPPHQSLGPRRLPHPFSSLAATCKLRQGAHKTFDHNILLAALARDSSRLYIDVISPDSILEVGPALFALR